MKKLLCILLALAMLFALAACGRKADLGAPVTQDGDDGDLAYVRAKGTLIVGITDFAPMDYQDAAGEWIGFDADMARAFAESLGVAVEFIEIDWDNKLLELNDKNIDCIWNGMTLTNEVLASMGCSDPYWNNSQVVVMKADTAALYPDAASMAGLSFAVEAGSAGEAAAEEAGFACTAMLTQADALMEVAAGTSDACVIDLSMAKAMTGAGTSYADLVYEVALNEEVYGVGFRQGSELVAAYNAFYAKAFADGTVKTIADKYDVAEFIIG